MQIEAWDSVANAVDFNLEIDTPEFMLLVPKDTTILDYGCGYGRICEIMNVLGYGNILGVDSSHEMIRRGNLKYPHLSLQQTQGAALQYPDDNFGAIVLLCGTDMHTRTSSKARCTGRNNKVIKAWWNSAYGRVL